MRPNYKMREYTYNYTAKNLILFIELVALFSVESPGEGIVITIRGMWPNRCKLAWYELICHVSALPV